MTLETLKSKAVFDRLVDMLVLALSKGSDQDVESLLRALHDLRPRLGELDLLEAQFATRQRRWADAIRLLRGFEAQREAPEAKAMLAYALFFSGDPTWRISANEVMQSGEASGGAYDMVKVLLDPGSCVPLSKKKEEADAAEAAAAAGDAGFDLQGFMRA